MLTGRSFAVASLLALCAAPPLLLGACSAVQAPARHPEDRRTVFRVTDWTVNSSACAPEGPSVREQRTPTHLVFNPLRETQDEQAIATTCVLTGGATNACRNEGDALNLHADVSLRLVKLEDGVWGAERVVVEPGERCTGFIEEARLTFPHTERFLVELRRSPFDLDDPERCRARGMSQAREQGCTELEVLHGDFATLLLVPVVVPTGSPSRSGEGSGRRSRSLPSWDDDD